MPARGLVVEQHRRRGDLGHEEVGRPVAVVVEHHERALVARHVAARPGGGRVVRAGPVVEEQLRRGRRERLALARDVGVHALDRVHVRVAIEVHVDEGIPPAPGGVDEAGVRDRIAEVDALRPPVVAHERVADIAAEEPARIGDVGDEQRQVPVGIHGRRHAHAVADTREPAPVAGIAERPVTQVLVEPVRAVVVGLVDVGQPVVGEVREDRREAVAVVALCAHRCRDVLEAVVADVAVETVGAREEALDLRPSRVRCALVGPVAEPDARVTGVVVVGQRHATDDVPGRIEARAGGDVGEVAAAVVAEDLRRSPRAARLVVGCDHEVGPAGAGEVDELGHARVRGDAAQARGLRHVAEATAAARCRIVVEQPRRVAGLAEQQHVEVAIAVDVADGGAVAHVLLHQRAVGVLRGEHRPGVADEVEAGSVRDVDTHGVVVRGADSPGHRCDDGAARDHGDDRRDDQPPTEPVPERDRRGGCGLDTRDAGGHVVPAPRRVMGMVDKVRCVAAPPEGRDGAASLRNAGSTDPARRLGFTKTGT